MEDKGRVRLSKRMNFRKNSKRPFTAPSFSENHNAIFSANPSLKPHVNFSSSGDQNGRKCIHDTSGKALSVHFLNERILDNLHSLSH